MNTHIYSFMHMLKFCVTGTFQGSDYWLHFQKQRLLT